MNDVLSAVHAVFGDADKAERWLRRPTSALGGRAPLEMTGSVEGRKSVLDLLARIDHGISA